MNGPYLPIGSAELRRFLERHGWTRVASRGDHEIYSFSGSGPRVAVTSGGRWSKQQPRNAIKTICAAMKIDIEALRRAL